MQPGQLLQRHSRVEGSFHSCQDTSRTWHGLGVRRMAVATRLVVTLFGCYHSRIMPGGLGVK